jgi:hypothetical protein
MPNRRLSNEERARLAPLISEIRSTLREIAGSDEALFWALRRRVWVQLQFEERGTPAQRAALKKQKRVEQNNRCKECSEPLDVSFIVLDRHDAMLGYTTQNTQLLCQKCDRAKQATLKYT